MFLGFPANTFIGDIFKYFAGLVYIQNTNILYLFIFWGVILAHFVVF
jgi:hypothetical protein